MNISLGKGARPGDPDMLELFQGVAQSIDGLFNSDVDSNNGHRDILLNQYSNIAGASLTFNGKYWVFDIVTSGTSSEVHDINKDLKTFSTATDNNSKIDTKVGQVKAQLADLKTQQATAYKQASDDATTAVESLISKLTDQEAATKKANAQKISDYNAQQDAALAEFTQSLNAKVAALNPGAEPTDEGTTSGSTTTNTAPTDTGSATGSTTTSTDTSNTKGSTTTTPATNAGDTTGSTTTQTNTGSVTGSTTTPTDTGNTKGSTTTTPTTNTGDTTGSTTTQTNTGSVTGSTTAPTDTGSTKGSTTTTPTTNTGNANGSTTASTNTGSTAGSTTTTPTTNTGNMTGLTTIPTNTDSVTGSTTTPTDVNDAIGTTVMRSANSGTVTSTATPVREQSTVKQQLNSTSNLTAPTQISQPTITTTRKAARVAKQQTTNAYPQTGEATSGLAGIGIALLGLIGLAGVTVRRREL